MRVCLDWNLCYQTAASYARASLTFLDQQIKAIWAKIRAVYQESFKELPELVLSPHSMGPNPYNKAYKTVGWPWYLNNAWGAWGNSKRLDGAARLKDPYEKVTALHASTLGHNLPGIYRLIANDAEVDAIDIRGQTPSYWAAYFGNLSALMIFKIYGADLNAIDSRGKSILRAAAKYDQDRIISFLATHKVDLNVVDKKGLTPLHVAAFNGSFSAYEKLKFYGADTTIQDPLGRTAEDMLKLKYEEIYHKRWFIFRLFTSPNPPPSLLQPVNEENLRAKIK